jgi:hypothetical protein
MRTDVIGPGGKVANTRRELSGERCHLEFKPDQAGFYTLGAPRPAYAFGINPATDQSDLRPMDKNLLPTEFSDHHEARVLAGADDYDTLAHGRPIFHYLIFAALGFLLLESGFQYLIRRKPA